MSKHCLICGDITKCGCSYCKQAHTSDMCARCSEETTTADYTDTAPSPASDRESSRREHKPLPYDSIYPYLPFLMRKLGFQYLALALEKIEGSDSGWNTFFDPLTKRHIVKKRRLPDKEESPDYIIRDKQDDEMIREYLQKVGKIYKDRKKNFKL